MQLIICTLWELNRFSHRGLFVLMTPIGGYPLFRESIVMALFLGSTDQRVGI